MSLMISMQSADPQNLTVHQLSAALRSRRVSSGELVNIMLDRIATHDQKLHAFVALYADEARWQPKRPTQRYVPGTRLDRCMAFRLPLRI